MMNLLGPRCRVAHATKVSKSNLITIKRSQRCEDVSKYRQRLRRQPWPGTLWRYKFCMLPKVFMYRDHIACHTSALKSSPQPSAKGSSMSKKCIWRRSKQLFTSHQLFSNRVSFGSKNEWTDLDYCQSQRVRMPARSKGAPAYPFRAQFKMGKRSECAVSKQIIVFPWKGRYFIQQLQRASRLTLANIGTVKLERWQCYGDIEREFIEHKLNWYW